MLRDHRVIEPSDLARSPWEHYQAVLDRDELARSERPTQNEIEAARAALYKKLGDGDFPVDPLALLDAQLDYFVMLDAAKLDQSAKKAALAHLKEHLGANNTALIAHEVDDYTRHHGLSVVRGDAAWISLARHLMRAHIEALKRTIERDEGDFTGLPQDPIVKPFVGDVSTRAMPGEAIIALFDVYRAQNPRSIGAYTLSEAKRDVALFASTVPKNAAVSVIDKKSVREWKALLLRYPVRAAKNNVFEGLSMAEIVERNEVIGKKVISNRTVNRHLSSLSAFCDWLESEGRISQNPVPGMFQTTEDIETTIPFTTEELNSFFQSPLFMGCQADAPWSKMAKKGDILIRDYRYWVPLIMLFSGARPGEIAQLDLSDLRLQDDVWIFHITDHTAEGRKSATKSTKTKGSRRIVPVHSALIKLGLLTVAKEMLRDGATRLFPNALPTARGQMIGDYSREFGKYLTRIGIKEGRGLSLYSFRHGAADALRRAGYLEADFKHILGHGSATTTGLYGILPQGMLNSRVELIEAIQYPNLEIDHLCGQP